MRIEILVLVSLALIACHPSAPPAPVCGDHICSVGEVCPVDCDIAPPNNCGNGICDAGESNATCPADCPVVEPPPDDFCKKGAKTRWLTFGYYSMFAASDPATPDYESFAEDVCKSKFTGISVHLLSPWDKLKGGTPKADDWPFVFTHGKFDVTKINSAWVAKLDRFLDAFGKRGLDVEVSFADQYCCTPGLNKYLPQQYHVFRQNNIGINWNADPEPLYSSITFAPITFHHISWTNVDEHKLKWNFAIKSKAASMMDFYYQAVVNSVVSALNKYPAMRVAWKLENETKGGDTLKDTRGDRSELTVNVSLRFAAKGYPPSSKRLLLFVDRDYVSTSSNAVSKQKVLHDSIVRAYGVQDGLGGVHELHGMCDPATINARITNGTAAKKDTLFSNDGNRCSAAYPNGPKQIIAMNLPFTDLKMEEAWTAFPKYNQGNINQSWKRYAKVHLELAQ